MPTQQQTNLTNFLARLNANTLNTTDQALLTETLNLIIPRWGFATGPGAPPDARGSVLGPSEEVNAREWMALLYAEAEGTGAAGGTLARNTASGPNAAQVIPQTPAQVTVDWLEIESTGAAGTNVPVTPTTTGKMALRGVIMVEISGELAEDVVQVDVLVDGVQLYSVQSGIDAPAGAGSSFVAIPLLFAGFALTVGVTHNFQVKLSVVNQSTTNITLPAPGTPLPGQSTLEITEYATLATG